MLTAMALVLDVGDSALGPPIDGLWQLLAVAVPIAPSSYPVASSTTGPGAKEGGTVLFVGEVGEAIEAEPEAAVSRSSRGVVRVDKSEIVLEDLEPVVLPLLEGTVDAAVLGAPAEVQHAYLLVGALQAPDAVLRVVGDDGHVLGDG